MLLDYVAVDYGGVVSSGKVLKDSEYAEMQEFAAAARRDMGELPQDAGLKVRPTVLSGRCLQMWEPASLSSPMVCVCCADDLKFFLV